MHDLELKHRLRRGQQRIDELKEIEKLRAWENAGIIRRTWWWVTGPPRTEDSERK